MHSDLIGVDAGSSKEGPKSNTVWPADDGCKVWCRTLNQGCKPSSLTLTLQKSSFTGTRRWPHVPKLDLSKALAITKEELA